MKSLHSGEGNNYIDRYGDSRQYTTVDWSPKSRISTDNGSIEDAIAAHEKDKQDLIAKILDMHPTHCTSDAARAALIQRGEKGFSWRKDAVELLVKGDIMQGWDLYKMLCIHAGTWDSIP